MIRGKIFLVAILLILLLIMVPYLPWFKTTESRQAHIPETPPDEMIEEIDSDGDLLTNNDEINLTNTHPGNPDTDNDGMLDGEEYEYWEERYSDAKDKDVPDWLEKRQPHLSDSERKGMYKSTGDLDGDGETNIRDRDSDNDGLSDGFEIRNGLDPADPNSNYYDLPENKRKYIYKSGYAGNAMLAFSDRLNLYDFNTELLDDFSSFYGILFRVTPAANPRYWRTAVYDIYHDGSWSTSSNVRPNAKYTGQEIKYNVTTYEKVSKFTYNISFEGLLQGMLPNALYTTGVHSLEPPGNLIYNDIGVFKSYQLLRTYSFNCSVYKYSLSDLRAATVPASISNENLISNDRINNDIAQLALGLTAGKKSDFEKAYAIAKYLATNFIYDINSYDHNLYYGLQNNNDDSYSQVRNYDKVLSNMLFRTYRGRCIDFATAFVLMCRANGIPAQLAVGFAPGDIEDPSANERVVRIGHGHAWGEVLLSGVGWLPFEVTPNQAIYGNTTGVHSTGADNAVISVPMDATNATLDHLFNGTGGGTTTNIFIDLEELINHPKLDSDMDGTPNSKDTDDDNDGISDLEELNLGTHPLKKDTDGDGLTDYEEVYEYDTSPIFADTDNDGLTDYYEVKISETDPLLYDTDGGGAYDALEVVMGKDPKDPGDDEEIIDSDDDGLSNAKEKTIGTDPYNPDTDYGGAEDGVEVVAGLDPINDPQDDLKAIDSDHDGLMDAKELEEKSDRFNPDTDGGGVKDGVEYQLRDIYEFNLSNASDDYKLLDNDDDGLYNVVEETIGTDPDDPDSDGGGVDDGIEVLNGFNPLDSSDDARIDSDGDGLPDLLEKELGTDPFDTDTDNDGLPDGWIDYNKNNKRDLGEFEDRDTNGETPYGDKYKWNDGAGPGETSPWDPDSDNDGILDGLEIEFGTDPLNPDTDGDGLTDWEEINWFTDPGNPDTDGDGLYDGPEVKEFFTNPTELDSDGDGINDNLEIRTYNTDPRRVDTDGDGVWDGFEIDADTSPRDSSDRPSGSDRDSRETIRPDPESVWPDPDDPGFDPDTHKPDPFSSNDRSDPNNSNLGTDGGLTRVLPLVIGLILIVIIVLYYISWRKQHIEEIADVAEDTEITLMGISEEEIDSIRRAIFEAYRSMLKVMQKYDFVRKKSMTPREFQKVIEEALPISNKNLDGLTRIFEEARYSNHKLDTHIRDRAINCFRDLKNELRGIKWGQVHETGEGETKSEPAIAG